MIKASTCCWQGSPNAWSLPDLQHLSQLQRQTSLHANWQWDGGPHHCKSIAQIHTVYIRCTVNPPKHNCTWQVHIRAIICATYTFRTREGSSILPQTPEPLLLSRMMLHPQWNIIHFHHTQMHERRVYDLQGRTCALLCIYTHPLFFRNMSFMLREETCFLEKNYYPNPRVPHRCITHSLNITMHELQQKFLERLTGAGRVWFVNTTFE